MASANPIASQILRARQVPETRHVQLTYGHDQGGGGTLETPTKVQRDGSPLELAWVLLTGGFTANTGSGLTSVDATQTCDCDVPVGAHEYKVALPGLSGEIRVSVTVVEGMSPLPPREDLDATADSDADTEVYPWDIPEPTAMQGLDCVSVCGGGTAEPVAEPVVEPIEDAGSTDTAAAPDTGGTVGGDKTDATGGGGCAASGSGLAALFGLVALGLLAVIRRRRRA